MAKSIGATLFLKDGNFYTGIKKASDATNNFKKKLQSLVGQNNNVKKTNTSTTNSLKSMTGSIVGAASAYIGFSTAKNFLSDCTTGVKELERANSRLNTLMMNVSGTTQTQVQDIISYGDELERVTTIEGDATVAGASQLATFQLQSSTIKKLLPSLQDLAVSSYGVSVSQEQMQSMANLVGKVMTGSASALTRYGVTMDENQKKILQTGTESERAAVLVDVLGQNFGGLAQSMAKTDEGKAIQLRNLWGSVKDVIGSGVLPIYQSFVSFAVSKIPTVTNAVSSFVQTAQGIYNKIKPAIDNFKNAVSGAAQNIGNAFGSIDTAGISNIFTGVLSTGINVISKIIEVAGKFVSIIVNNWPSLKPGIMILVGAFVAYKAKMLALKTTLTAVSTAQKILNVVMNANPAIKAIAIITGLVTVFMLLWNKCEGFRNFFINMWNDMKGQVQLFINIFNAVKNGIANGLNAAKQVVSEKLGNIKSAYEEHGGGIKGIAAAGMEAVKMQYEAGYNFLNKITGGKFGEMLNTVKEKFTNIKDSIVGIWEGIKSKTSEIWGGIVGGIKGFINKIIDRINVLIRGANKIQFDVPDWVPGMGGKKFGFNIPEIPQLAHGGVIQRPGTVMVGERGPEYLSLPKGAQVTPLNKAPNKTYYVTININGTNKSTDEIVDDLVPKLKLAIGNI